MYTDNKEIDKLLIECRKTSLRLKRLGFDVSMEEILKYFSKKNNPFKPNEQILNELTKGGWNEQDKKLGSETANT